MRKLLPLELRALDDCLELFSTTVSQLRTILADLSASTSPEMAYYDDIQTFLNGAMTNQYTCLDGFVYIVEFMAKQVYMNEISHEWLATRISHDSRWDLDPIPLRSNSCGILDRGWHVLGLGYDPALNKTKMDNAGVVNYNGNYKPWLDLANAKYKPYWSKYVSFDNFYLQLCDLNE